MKIFKWILKSLIFGICAIFIFNIIGQYINLNIPINILNILIISFLRIPGLAMLVVFLTLF